MTRTCIICEVISGTVCAIKTSEESCSRSHKGRCTNNSHAINSYRSHWSREEEGREGDGGGEGTWGRWSASTLVRRHAALVLPSHSGTSVCSCRIDDLLEVHCGWSSCPGRSRTVGFQLLAILLFLCLLFHNFHWVFRSCYFKSSNSPQFTGRKNDFCSSRQLV